MKLVLFSNPDDGVIEKLEHEILPPGRKNIFGYMQADGNNPKPQYMPLWQDFASRNGAEFIEFNNVQKINPEITEKFSKINSLLVAGGNVFALLKNIQENGYDDLIIKKSREEDFIYSGFSAGAIIATPNIRVAGEENGWSFGYDENLVGIRDTAGLALVDFEMLPHYKAGLDEEAVLKFEKRYNTTLRCVSDSEYIIIGRGND